MKVVSCLCSIQGGCQAYIGSRTAVILYNSLKLLDHIGGVLDGDFYPFKVFKLIRFELLGNRVTQFAATKANDAELIYDIVGDVVYE